MPVIRFTGLVTHGSSDNGVEGMRKEKRKEWRKEREREDRG